MLRTTAPTYGLLQWKREPHLTWRARTLAIDHGYGRVQSLAVARTQLADEARRAALAGHIEAKIRARHENDPILASIAATTTPIDEVAQELIDMIDAHGWAVVINAQIQPPAAPTPTPVPHPYEPGADLDDQDDVRDDRLDHEVNDDREADDDRREHLDQLTDLVAIMPTKAHGYQRWRAWWHEISVRPDATNQQLADDFHTSKRTVQRIRAVGAAGLLDSPQPPHGRRLHLATANGVPHSELTS
jgi:hypothetical protein